MKRVIMERLMPQYVTPRQLAETMDVTPQLITKWCRDGYFDGHAQLLSGRWVITLSPFLLASLPMVSTTRPDGRHNGVKVAIKRGRPKGSKNKNPYPPRCKKIP